MKKGTLALAGLVAALALPVSAGGATEAGAEGATAERGAQDLQIRFTLRSREGEPTALRRFRFSGLTAECAGGASVNTEGRIRSIPVNDRNRFRKTIRRTSKTIKVRGRVSNDLDRVVGRIRVEGDLRGEQNCDSEFVRWRAS